MHVEDYRKHVNPYRVANFEALEWAEDFVKARGCTLEDASGRPFLDMAAGFGAASLGHNHPALCQALTDALRSELPGTMHFAIPRRVGELAEELCRVAGAGLAKVYFGNSGAEGIEAAMKFAMACTGRHTFVSFEGGYHGLTLGALGLMGRDTMWRKPFPHVAGHGRVVPFGHLEAVHDCLSRGNIAAVVLEVVQGVGGGRPWPAEDLVHLAEQCRRHGTLIIVDEVLTGIARTGKWFAFQWLADEFRPDIVVVSKGLTGGIVPLSAVLMSDEVFESAFGVSGGGNVHGSTFSGNLLAMTAGLAVLRAIHEQDLLARVVHAGQRLESGVQRLCAEQPGIVNAQGLGLLLGVQIHGLAAPGDTLGAMACCRTLRDLGVVTALAPHALNCLKLTPPLIISDSEIDFFLARLGEVAEALAEAIAPSR